MRNHSPFIACPSFGRRTALMIAVTLATAFAHSHSADWMGFRGPNGSGVAADAQPTITWSETQNLQWKTALPGPGTSSPIVVGSRIFVTCYSGYGDGTGGDPAKLQRELVCINRTDGKILWSTAPPAAQLEDSFYCEGAHCALPKCPFDELNAPSRPNPQQLPKS